MEQVCGASNTMTQQFLGWILNLLYAFSETEYNYFAPSKWECILNVLPGLMFADLFVGFLTKPHLQIDISSHKQAQ